ncbi:hypothetical protein [Bacillus sp. AFS041924]|uniref:hypothetical protein n=1 Tax=Bacillus sp. AFS041924 TaxID=2033503 RepID=UPI000BFB8D1B|nr:hypothetical protein [Bacillus sp. AFS041924]PGS46507.1 hypothetical protein COC46_20880 [Bacillus sp. AFS041924]
MFSIETFVARPKQFIEEKLSYYSEKHFANNPEICYTNLKNKDIVLNLYKQGNVEPDYMHICIYIKYQDKVILGYDMNGLNLWEDITNSLKSLLDDSPDKVYFGIEPIYINLKELGKNLLKFEVIEEISNQPFYSNTLNRDEFIKHLVKGGVEYYSTLLEYNFPNKNKIDDQIKKLKELEIKLLVI